MTTPSDPLVLLRSRSYVALLVLAAIIGVPVSAAASFFLALVSKMRGWIFTNLPKGLGFHSEPPASARLTPSPAPQAETAPLARQPSAPVGPAPDRAAEP
jgi:hypothetical protein